MWYLIFFSELVALVPFTQFALNVVLEDGGFSFPQSLNGSSEGNDLELKVNPSLLCSLSPALDCNISASNWVMRKVEKQKINCLGITYDGYED